MPFLTDKAAKERITELDNQIETLESDNTAAQDRITELETEVADKDKTITEQAVTIETAETEAAESVEKITNLESDLEASQKETVETRESVGKQVAEALAGVGQPKPLKIESSEPGGESNEVTREEFNAMSPRGRSEFSKNGGKIKTQ